MSRWPEMGMNKKVASQPLTEAGDAIASVVWAWERFDDARSEAGRASALLELSNAISDLESWHVDYDYERGRIWDVASLAKHGI